MKAEIFKIEDFKNKYYKQNLVIEASAGTGKTYSVTKMVKEIVKKGIKPKEILIVTYTEKATGELKDRIRKELNDATLKIDKTDLDNLNIYTIHSFCQNAIKEFGLLANQPLQLDVIDEPTEVKDFFDIYVRSNVNLLNCIDKICVKLGYIFRVVDINEKSNDLKKYFVSAILKYYLNSDYKVDKSIISYKYDAGIKSYFDNIINGKTISFDEYRGLDPEFDDNYNELLVSTNKYCRGLAEEIKINFNDSQTINFNGRKYTTKTFKTSDELKLLEYFKEKKEKYEGFDKLDDNKLDKVKKAICEYLTTEFIDDFYEKWQINKEKNKWQTFNDMLRTIREVINREYEKSEKPFTNALKKKYKYAIIDEFQDTNQLQFDTFKRLFMYDGGEPALNNNIIVVGDLKQSIYSFQGADLSVYEKAKEEIVKNGGKFLRLDTNYRSTKKMIDSCNKLFEDGFFDKRKDEDGNEYDIFESSCSPDDNLRDSKLNNVSTKSIWIGMKLSKIRKENESAEIEEENDEDNLDNTVETNSVDTTVDEYEFAKIAVKSIIECCGYISKDKTKLRLTDKDGNERNVSFKDFAILARTRSEMFPIERELKRCGIPFIKYKDNGLFSSRECDEWKAIFEVINTEDLTGYNRKKYKKALFTDFFGRNLEEINDEDFNHDEGFEFECIKRWKNLAHDFKWEDLIEDIIFNSHLLDNLKSLDKLQSLTLYKQLGDFCISYLYDNHNLTELINRLDNVTNDEDDENSGIVEIGTDFDCVKLMTIHASKGLQYPIVITVAGYKAPKSSIDYTFHDEKDNKYRKITFESKDAVNELRDEWIRLLYVCFTRAEYINIIPYYDKGSKKGNYYSEILNVRIKKYIEMYKDKNEYEKKYYEGIDYSKARNEVKNILKNSDSKESAKVPVNIKEFIESLNSKKTYKHSYASLSHPKGEIEEVEEFEDDEKEKEGPALDSVSLKEFDKDGISIEVNYTTDTHRSYEGLPRGAEIGTALHEVFEHSDFTNYEPKLDEIISDRLKANRIKETDDLKKYIHELVGNVLNAELPIIHGPGKVEGSFKLSEIPDSDKKPEIEFNFNLDEQKLKNYFNGFVDLIFRRGNFYSILDWKSDTISDDLLGYNNEFNNKNISSLKDHTDNHYSIQRVLYSYCLIKWLKNYYDLSEEEIFKQHFGGVYYVYIRGCKENSGNGIYAHTWKSYDDLKKAFDNIKKRIGGK